VKVAIAGGFSETGASTVNALLEFLHPSFLVDIVKRFGKPRLNKVKS
jgi:hypothetical protein